MLNVAEAGSLTVIGMVQAGRSRESPTSFRCRSCCGV